MYQLRLIFLLFILHSLFGCTTTEVEKYVFKESAENAEIEKEQTHWKEVIYKKGNYAFFPRFYSMTKSYTNPGSRLIVYSSSQQTIYLKNVKIISAEGTYSNERDIGRRLKLDKYSEDRQSGYVDVALFNEENLYMENYWSEGDITVQLQYVSSSGENEELVFEFALRKRREIVWPT